MMGQSARTGFLLRFGFVAGVFFLFVATEPGEVWLADPLTRLAASAGGGLLSLFGVEVERVGAMLSIDARGVEVVPGCNGLETIGLLLAAGFSFPARPVERAGLLVGGTAIALGLNAVRVATLALAYARWPDAFPLLHQTLWPILVVGTILLLWSRWTERVAARVRAT